ncbi:Calpain-7 [Armadillidium nasatum]|uniref:Calpain-7 n=1 Tax=Armadillidium nasatum TaxID=96803 RepID=A0A5N5SKE0_9CRUS|nr:Calpain-7 [Armadillidium nasatum]
MADYESLIRRALEAANLATNFDTTGKTEPAMYMYALAASYLKEASNLKQDSESLLIKASEYAKRAEILVMNELDKNSKGIKFESGRSELGRANFLLLEALELDEAGEESEAVEMYTNAVELCLKVSKEVTDEDIKEKLRSLASKALSRAELLKGISKNLGESNDSKSATSSKLSPNRVIPPLGIGNLSSPKPERKAGTQGKGLQLVGKASYTREELEVLRRTSIINKREYVPFMSVDLKEKFAFSLPFTDKDGTLALSPKQKKMFEKWCRPEDISTEPKMIEVIDCFSIKQTCVSDCSFVASVAISALYEKRFKKRLITDIIFPKNRKGDPVYNPCGKYMIKLHVNGIPRKIIIDDLLPVGKYNSLLCSYSTNKNEFWISLIEKAYMKVMGGYDFPGSNSNIDLYALTGWIPERISLKDSDFNEDAVFKKILSRFQKGDLLVTVATGEMSDLVAERAGLVSTHAYAMLDIKEVKGKRLFLLKNPWSHLRWKGNFSELDKVNWTPEMCKALNFDPQSAQMFDNGVFWIDYNSLCHFYDVIYMNWNPALFSHTFCTHQTWNAGVGPVRDLYNIGENPQYSLEVQPHGATGVAVWVLLTRHITDIEDFRNNQEYITLLVYKTGGKRIFYPFDPPPYIDGVRINSPHYLCKILLKESSVEKFTLVVSQYEKQNTIHYSLRIYSTCPFSLTKLQNICKHKHEEKNKWSGRSAGGCPNHPVTYKNNPIYQLRTESNIQSLRIELKAPKEIQIGFEIICVEAKNTESPSYFSKLRSGAYRCGFCVTEIENVVAGVYNVIASTFYPAQEAPFYLTFYSSSPVKISRLQ